MIEAPLALAFTAGMVASVNPCGFAMLPAYVAYFLGLEGDAPVSAAQRSRRALLTASVVSAGFLLVFGVVGAIVTLGIRSVIDYVPWISIGIGGVLVVLGIAMLFGYRLKMALPQVEHGGDSRRVKSMFIFGTSYAVASLSCTLPVFLAVVSGTVTRANFASGMAAFLAYAAGMSVILFTLTLAVAAANSAVVGALRRASRYVDRGAGILLIIAGTYIVYYWTWFKVTDVTSTTGDGPIRLVTELSSSATEFIAANQGAIIAIFMVIIVVALAVARTGRSRGSQPRDLVDAPDSASTEHLVASDAAAELSFDDEAW
jgi:cytochrome c-type biogenesis protein